MHYLKWFYNVIYGIPTDVTNSSNFIESSENFPLIIGNVCNYVMIFLLSPISGEDEDLGIWDRLLKVNYKIPIVTFYRAAYINQNSAFKLLFNVNPICEEEGYIKDISFSDKTLGQRIEYPSVEDSASGYNSVNDKDNFIAIEPLRKDEGFKPLMLYKDKIVGSQSGLNIFIGQKGVAIPREDRALEFDRPIYFLRLLDNLIKKSPAGYLRLKPAKWPVVLRMDDPPATWELVSEKRKILTPECYSEIINILAEHGAKITCFITPASIYKDGEIKPWTETDYDYAKIVLNILRDGSKKGVVEIGIHGLTHLTIGYKPPSGITGLLSKVGLVKYNLAREFYDSMLKKEIPYQLQKKQLEESAKLIKGFFGNNPKAFAPPTHVWDDSTEKALFEMGIPYFSADMNFYLYPEGYDFRKNPSPIGESACNDEVLYVSATILSNYGTFQKTLKLFNELGVPLLWQQHNFYPSWFTPQTLKSFFKDLEIFDDKAYMTVGELGDLLRSYRRIQSHATLESGLIKLEVNTEIPTIVEAYQKGKTQVRKIPAGHHHIELNL